jgi:cysteine desulfurase
LAPRLYGGGHERGMRSGTLDVPGIVGLGAALELSGQCMKEESSRLLALREKLYQSLVQGLEEVTLNGHPTERLPNNLNLSFSYVKSEALMREMSEVAVSSASACTSAEPRPSHVLKALGLSDELARSSIRFGLGRFNTEEEVDYVARRTLEAVQKLRSESPQYEMLRKGS